MVLWCFFIVKIKIWREEYFDLLLEFFILIY